MLVCSINCKQDHTVLDGISICYNFTASMKLPTLDWVNKTKYFCTHECWVPRLKRQSSVGLKGEWYTCSCNPGKCIVSENFVLTNNHVLRLINIVLQLCVILFQVVNDSQIQDQTRDILNVHNG